MYKKLSRKTSQQEPLNIRTTSPLNDFCDKFRLIEIIDTGSIIGW